MLAVLAWSACDSKARAAPAPQPEPARPANPARDIDAYDPLPGIVLAITSITGGSNADGTFAPGDTLVVRYTARTNAGAPLNVGELDGGSILVSGPTFNYQRVIAEQTDLRSASVYEGEGAWRYQFAVPLPSVYQAPLNDTASFADGELTGQALLAGTYSVGLELWAAYQDANDAEFVDAGNAVGDWLFGGATVLTPRAVSQADNCNVCHTGLRVHDGRMRDVRMCVLCHTAGAEDSNLLAATPGVTIEFQVMIHRLHNGSHLPSVLGMSTDSNGNRVYPGQVGAVAPRPVQFAHEDGDEVSDYSAANFPVWPNLTVAMPRDRGYSSLSGTDPDGAGPLLSARACEDTFRTGAAACAKCHGDPDGTGPLAAPAQGGLAYSQPNRRACGACHDDVDWSKPYGANGLTMEAQSNDSRCIECHTNQASNQPDATLKPLSVLEAHLHPLVDPAVDPGVNSTITAVGGGSGPAGKFQVGDSPAITFTLKNDAGDDIGLSTMDSCSAFFFGPTNKRQLVAPFPSPNGMSLNPFDFGGRLQASSTSNKGQMTKVFQNGTAANEILVVQFSSATAFSVDRVNRTTGASLGALVASALPAGASTNPSGSSVSAFELNPGLAAGTFQITFTSATHFDITGAVGGSGDMPAATSASTRFTSTDISFNLSVGTTPFAAGNTIHGVLVRGGAANPVLFAIIAGRTAFASGDRIYSEVVPDAATYTVNIPMDIVLEFLADTGGAPAGGTALPAAGNLPVYFGRQQVWEAATTATTTTTLAGVAPLDRSVAVNAAAGFLNGDTVVIEPAAGVGTREYVQIAPADSNGVIITSTEPGNGTLARIYFKTPLRYLHNAGATITKVTLTFKQEGTAYSLNPATGVITSIPAFTANRAIVMSYRTDARFGYKRHSADAFQGNYVPPANDSPDIGQEQGDWHGLPYLAGTYTADIWLYKNIDFGKQGEVQTYRSTSNAGTIDFLYGSATAIEPHAIISASASCYTCHNDVIFHGGGRRGVDACLTCHSISGNEDKPRWDTPKVGSSTTNTALTPGVAIEFRQMLHKIHKGRELAYADTYTVVGNGGNPGTFGEIEFPAMPGGVRQCVRCHGNDAWKEPAPRVHTSATFLTRTWTVVCGSCHDNDAAQAHLAANTSAFGAESCSVCHGQGREFAVEKVHLPR
ncbi:MAG: hypothetical protein WAT39_04980 [Planctomycetota bacterium]